MDELIFTPASLVDLLSQIEELQGLSLMVSESIDNNIILQIGSSTYVIKPKQDIEVKADIDVVEAISDANESAYEELSDDLEISIDNAVDIEAGPIKEFLKTLLVGGMVRMGIKALK